MSEVIATDEAAVVAAEDKLAADQAAGGPWFYCLDPKHPGSNQILDDSRFFESNDPNCPVCPACGHQVSAVPAEGKGIYPSSILAVAARLV